MDYEKLDHIGYIESSPLVLSGGCLRFTEDRLDGIPLRGLCTMDIPSHLCKMSRLRRVLYVYVYGAIRFSITTHDTIMSMMGVEKQFIFTSLFDVYMSLWTVTARDKSNLSGILKYEYKTATRSWEVVPFSTHEREQMSCGFSG